MARISDRDCMKTSLVMRGKCENPLDEYLHTVVNFDLFFLAATKKEVRFTVANQIFYRSDIANWIIKFKINADFKHPKGKHAYKSKALADVYSAVFDACQALHTWVSLVSMKMLVYGSPLSFMSSFCVVQMEVERMNVLRN